MTARRSGRRWTTDDVNAVDAVRAKRAKACAVADGHAEPSSMDKSIATIERVVASEMARPRIVVPERDVVVECLDALARCPCVAFAHRSNTGLLKSPDGERWVRAGVKGMSDITGMLKGGQALYIECKRVGKDLTDEQRNFMVQVNTNGGLGFVARSADDVFAYLRR